MPKTKEQAAEIVELLKEKYPSAECSLEYKGEAWKLLIMGRLSAQCTDARVNIVCEELFKRLPTLEAMANAPLEQIEELIKACGLYHSKAKNIKEACQMLIDEYNGELPDTMEELLKLPGVGRKIANLLLGDIYHKPAVVTDTHCIRICGRLGFYPESEKTPYKIEKILMTKIAPEEQSDFCHRLVLFGRETCSARAPLCDACQLNGHCAHFKKTMKKRGN
jgi:endonuclease-3